MPGELILDLTYALKVMGPSDEYLHIAEGVEVATAAISAPGSFLVDLIPLCRQNRGRSDELLTKNEFISEMDSSVGSWCWVSAQGSRMAQSEY
jgi:hypothetical protein